MFPTLPLVRALPLVLPLHHDNEAKGGEEGMGKEGGLGGVDQQDPILDSSFHV